MQQRFEQLSDWLAWQESLHPLAIDLGLERIKTVFNQLLPCYQKPLTITVAGTNGKGSTVAYLEAFYIAQGYCVGTYTSPHIVKYNERIKINGQSVLDKTICESFEKIDLVRRETTLSYFEFATLAALDIFAQKKVDIQILEVGLGGRLDAVNIIDADLAVVTSIDIDHVEWLGKTREEIGLEKAGIFRMCKPAIISDLRPPKSLLDYAYSKHVLLLQLGKTFFYEKQQETWTWQGLAQIIENLPHPALKGSHQYRNASAAILATQCLSSILPVNENAIRSGLKTVKLAGRFQHVAGKIPMLLDVGHNPQAVQTLVNYLDEHFPHQRIYAIFSMMKDKDILQVLNLMQSSITQWFCVSLINNSRAASDMLMRECFKKAQLENVTFGFTNFLQGFNAAESQQPAADLIVVFGSFFLVSDCCITLKTGEFDENRS